MHCPVSDLMTKTDGKFGLVIITEMVSTNSPSRLAAGLAASVSVTSLMATKLAFSDSFGFLTHFSTSTSLTFHKVMLTCSARVGVSHTNN